MSATLCSCVCFLLLTCADGATCPRDIFAAGPEKDETSLLQVASHVKRKGQKDQVRHADVADSETKEVVDEEDLDKRAEAMTQIFTGIASSVKSRCNDWFANLRKRAWKGETWTGWIAGFLLDILIVWPLGTAIRKNMWNYCDAYSQSQLFALPSLIGLSAWILSDSLQDGTFGVYMAWYWAVLICTVLGCAAQLINYCFPYPSGALCELPCETWSREKYEKQMRDAGQTLSYEVQADEQSKPKAGGQVPAQSQYEQAQPQYGQAQPQYRQAQPANFPQYAQAQGLSQAQSYAQPTYSQGQIVSQAYAQPQMYAQQPAFTQPQAYAQPQMYAQQPAFAQPQAQPQGYAQSAPLSPGSYAQQQGIAQPAFGQPQARMQGGFYR